MVSMDQFKRGVARYLDDEFTNKISGWQKWVFGAGAAMYLENLSASVEKLRQNEMVKALNIIDSNGNVDAEKLHRYFLKQAQKGPVTFTIPMIGTVTLSESDVDKLYNCVMQA